MLTIDYEWKPDLITYTYRGTVVATAKPRALSDGRIVWRLHFHVWREQFGPRVDGDWWNTEPMGYNVCALLTEMDARGGWV